ncbi:amino acid permease [Haladaptatus pallidirubidus]|uniref:Amino acid permease n=1 Tax=Haladaptatus pallidirubidus TaxID=1008152 RepID=A0AAV3UPT1_9EURY|nr:amino acid permease [Haladaptatus pallidirubidus]
MSTGDEELAKDLGPLAALTIGIGTMIGAGIFVLPGTAIENAGWYAVYSFIVGGAIALLTAFSASELGTAMPKSGGAYYYVNQALGPLFGSITGWANWLGLAFASSFYMIGFGQYIQAIFGIPELLSLGPIAISSVKIIALLGAAFFVFVNYVGAKETGRLQNIIVAILVVILAVFTVVGAFKADLTNLPAGKGLTPLITTTGIIFVSYLGFVQITSVAEEIKNPDKNLPRAILGSVVLVTSIYALVLFTMTAAVKEGFIAEQQLAGKIAVVEVGRLLLGPIGAVALLLGGLLATASSANASILASSRINFAMGRDRIVMPEINAIHHRFGTPYRAIGITGGLILLFIAAGSVELLATLGSVLHLIIYGLLNIALIVMREANAVDYEPSYRVPLYPVVPVLGAILSFALIAFISPTVILLSALLVVGAILWYLGYAQSRTTVQGILPEFILARRDTMPDAVVSAATSVKPDGGEYRVMVPLANPEHESNLITLASAIAKQRGGIVEAVHIVTVPDQTALESAADQFDAEKKESQALLDAAESDAESFGTHIEKSTIFSHLSFEKIFDTARIHDADMVVMGWGSESHGSPGRIESARDDLGTELPCDFLALKNRGFDPAHLLVPTAGGTSSDLSAEVAQLLQSEFDSQISLLHVNENQQAGREFLESWASERGLSDADLRVDDGDVSTAIANAAADCTMVIIGATGRGLLSRLMHGSSVVDAAEDVDCTVLLAERPTHRSFRERLFGQR